MNFLVEVNNKTDEVILEKKLQEVFASTIKKANIACLENKDLELSIAFVGEEEIQKINKEYRKKDSATDVLSFSEYETAEGFCLDAAAQKSPNVFIGELILCPEYIKRNAREDGETFAYALDYIVSHGILHVLGFPHGEKMFSLQRTVADELEK